MGVSERIEIKRESHMITEFTTEVISKLGYYVYLLIDPRTGNTFYVGKGRGNRTFAHVNDSLSKRNC